MATRTRRSSERSFESEDREARGLWELWLSAIVFIVVFSVVARADDESTALKSQSAIAAKGKVAKERAADFGLRADIERLSSMVIKKDGNDVARWEIGVRPGLTINETYSISALIEGVQDEENEEFDFGRGMIGLSRKGFDLFNGRSKFAPSLTLGLPLSASQRASSMQAVTVLAGRLQSTPKGMAIPNLSLGLNASVGKYFHEYDTAADGSVLTSHYSSQSGDVSYAFTDALSLTVELIHFDAFSYQGSHTDYIGHRQELKYAISPAIAVGFGHQWGDPYTSTLKANGRDFNFEALDETNSLIFGNLNVTL